MATKSYLSEKDAKYQRLLDISKKIAPEKPFLVLQKEVTEMWKTELLSGSDNALYVKKMDVLRVKLQSKKSGILAFMAKAPKVTADKESEPAKEEVVVVLENGEKKSEEKEEQQLYKLDPRKETKVQDELKKKISLLEKKVLLLLEERSIGVTEGKATALTAELKKTKETLEETKKQLTNKINVQKAVLKHREKKRSFETQLKIENPELARALKLRDAPGRPTIEEDNPGDNISDTKISFCKYVDHTTFTGILDVILKIATEGAACGDRRRSDIYRLTVTLNLLI
jgi:hypothetical protein